MKRLLLLSAFGAFAGLLLLGLSSLGMTEEKAEYVGAETCKGCHSDMYHAILKTKHAQKADPRTPFAAQGCETCHGPGSLHVKAGGKKGVGGMKVFGSKSPVAPEAQNQTCLGCHEKGLRMNWKGSPHEANQVVCADCHTVHNPVDPVRSRAPVPGGKGTQLGIQAYQAGVCFKCHTQQRAQIHRASSHPIKEGKVACSQCHNPHGSMGPSQLVKATVNETCYTCHAEKRGPFLWEHAPAREDCTNCHTPHGSNHPSLLKARTPWLCQQCHMAQFHPSTAYSGTGIPPAGAAQQLLAKSCLNCHSQVHGSNHPSGVRFTR